METTERLTVKEFAAAVGVSQQAIYKRLNNQNDRLNNYSTIGLSGQKLIDKRAIEIFGNLVEQPNSTNSTEVEQPSRQVEQPEKAAIQQDLGENHSTNHSTETEQVEQPKVDGGQMLDILRQTIATLTTQLAEKDAQIHFLQEQSAGQLQSIKDLTAALKQQQALTAGTMLLTEGSTQSGAAPGEIIEGERATPSDPDEATAPDPTKKKSLLSMIFGKRGKRP